jgi:hypothetical protein
MDANFRLKRKAVSSDAADPGLAEGWAYFVENQQYKSHLAQYGDQPQEVCTSLDCLALITYSSFCHAA